MAHKVVAVVNAVAGATPPFALLAQRTGLRYVSYDKLSVMLAHA